MSEEQKIMMFDKPTDWTYNDWINLTAYDLLNRIHKNVIEWICSSDMTNEEKDQHPKHETVGGYLKILNESECGQIWWNGLTVNEKCIVKSLPNFDAEIFEEITGIKID